MYIFSREELGNGKFVIYPEYKGVKLIDFLRQVVDVEHPDATVKIYNNLENAVEFLHKSKYRQSNMDQRIFDTPSYYISNNMYAVELEHVIE